MKTDTRQDVPVRSTMRGIKQHRIPAEGTLAPSKDFFLPIETTPHDGVRRDP